MPNGVAFNPPRFDVAYVISDLHIGGKTDNQMFEAAAQFRTFIDYLLEEVGQMRGKKADAQMLLVINGDFVDFLAEPGASVFSLDNASEILDRILHRPEFLPVLEALQDFVKEPGTKLVLTLGNHDVELALPDCRQTLLDLLSDKKRDREGKIQLCFEGWGYRFRVGDKIALCLHGNEPDEANFTRYDELDRIIQDIHLFGKSSFGDWWNPSAGSQLVIKAMNPIKQEFPFIDLLKPEKWLAVTVLGILDPSKIGYIEEAVDLITRAKTNELLRPGSQRRMLSTPTTAPDPAAAPAAAFPWQADTAGRGLTAEEIMRRVELAIADDNREQKMQELIHLSVDTEMLGWREVVGSMRDAVHWMKDKAVDLKDRVATALTEDARAVHRWALQKAIRRQVTDDPYDVGAMDDTDKAIAATVRKDYNVVFAGHTHFRRIAPQGDRTQLYVNTGTWAGLMTFTRALVDSEDFTKVYDALLSKKRDLLRKPLPGTDITLIRKECTVARMAGTGRNVTVALGGVADSVVFSNALTRKLA